MNSILGIFRRLLRSLESLHLDVRLGIRMLLKHPGLALVATFGIAVGVAIACGGFSVTYGNYLKASLPLEEGQRIVSIELWDSAAGKPEPRILHDFHVWRAGLKSIQDLGAFRRVAANLIAPAVPSQNVVVAVMSASGFTVARRLPLIGRYLEETDEHENAPPVIVISESVWRDRYGRDPWILERTIQLGATRHSIVGVMPEDFKFPFNDHFWVPLRDVGLIEPRTGLELMVFGRLTPGVTLEMAQAELATLGQRTALLFPAAYAHLRPRVMPYPRPFLGIHGADDVTGLHTMNGIVMVLLVLVCLNVAILVYTRTASRQSEISLRAALGASRGRIIAQLFTEALVLSVLGTFAGVALAEFALRHVAAATMPIASELPFWLSFHVSPAAILYAGVLSILAAGVVGILPAIRATKHTAQADTRVAGVSGSGMQLGRIWTVLIVGQVGFAVALLPGALFATWENLRLEFVGAGFAAAEFLTAKLEMDNVQGGDSAATGTPAFNRRYAVAHTALMRRLQAEPDVSIATFAMTIPGDEVGASIETEGGNETAQGMSFGVGRKGGSSASHTGTSGHAVRFNRVDANFFRALEVPILAGRPFEVADADREVDPAVNPTAGGVVVVNESLAKQVFGGQALGRRVRYIERDTDAEPKSGKAGGWYEIVGIVKDFPSGVSPEMNSSQLRLYHVAAAGQVRPVNIVVRVRGGAVSNFARRVPELAASVHPDLQLRSIMALDQALRKEQWIRRLEAAVLGAIALSVLMLSASGIYALMSFTVTRRRKEIGIRMALGADGVRIVASIFSRSLAQLAGGALLGAILAGTLEKLTGDNLMRGHATFVLSAVGLGMIAVGALASLGPARRCLRIEPTEALREQ